MANNKTGIGIVSGTTNLQTGNPGALARVITEKELVAESIHRIINTRPGERIRNPNFGSRIKDLLFEQNDFVLLRSGEFFLRQAINQFEPRVEIVKLQISIDEIDGHYLKIQVYFRLKSAYQQLLTTTVKVTA